MTKQSRGMYSFMGKLREKLTSGGTLRNHAFRGGTWLGLGGAFEQMFRFGRSMLLTRLLAPEAFGVMAIVYSASAVVDMLAEIGVKEAIIQNPRGQDDNFVNSAWWLAFGRGVGIYLLLFCASPWIARFYGNPELVPLMRVALLSIVFQGAQSSRSYVALKEMKFKRWTLIQSGGGVCGSLIVVALAFVVKSVWALAIGYAAENCVRCLASYVICPFRPSLRIDKDSLKELLRFSKGVFGLSFLNLIFSRADIFVLGKLYPAAQLGIYTMAVYLIQVPTSFIMGVLSQTLMTSFARIQEDSSRINRILVRVTSVLLILGMPIVIFVIFASGSLLSLFYGPRYAGASLPLTVAALVAIVNLMNSLITMAFYATGRPHLHRRCVLIMAVLMIAAIYPAARHFGPVGGQLAALAAVVAGYVSQLVDMRRLTRLDLAGYAKSFPFVFAVSCGVMGVLWGVRHLVVTSQPFVNLLFGMFGCILALGFCGGILLRQLSTET